jgi:hypothetical protein
VMNGSKHKSDKPIRAVLDARSVPFELFGHGRSAYIRKLVFMYLATWANPDGTDAYPSLQTIATHCGLTVRGLSNVLAWLAKYGLITVEYKASYLGTNRYTVALTDDALSAARLKMEADEGQASMRAKAERASKQRSDAAKSMWTKKKADKDLECSVPGESERDMECSVLGDVECSVPGGHGTGRILPGTSRMRPGMLRSTDRPLNRPKDRPETVQPSCDSESDSAATAAVEETPRLEQEPVIEALAGIEKETGIVERAPQLEGSSATAMFDEEVRHKLRRAVGLPCPRAPMTDTEYAERTALLKRQAAEIQSQLR